MCVPYAHNPESTWKILWTQLIKGSGRFGKFVMEIARLVNDGETAAGLKFNGKNTGYTPDLRG